MSLEPKFVVAIIVAAAENGVIGCGGRLPWHLPSDLKTFRRLTLAKPIVMGRKTFQSIGKALAGRDNIVISRDAAFAAPGIDVCASLADALALAETRAAARGATEIMVIGGAEIYRQATPVADRIYLTRVHASPEGDATFASPDPAAWRRISAEPIPPDPRDDHAATLEIYVRSGPLRA